MRPTTGAARLRDMRWRLIGSGVTATALVMLLIVLLANGMLRDIVQRIASGATLDLNAPPVPA